MGKGLVAGVDIGAATGKAVIMTDGEILGSVVIPTGHSIKQAAYDATQQALEAAGLWKEGFDFENDFDFVVVANIRDNY